MLASLLHIFASATGIDKQQHTPLYCMYCVKQHRFFRYVYNYYVRKTFLNCLFNRNYGERKNTKKTSLRGDILQPPPQKKMLIVSLTETQVCKRHNQTPSKFTQIHLGKYKKKSYNVTTFFLCGEGRYLAKL